MYADNAEAIAEAVQRPTMKFVSTKTAEQLELQAWHRGRERLVSQRTGVINQIRAFLLERGVAVRHRQIKRLLATHGRTIHWGQPATNHGSLPMGRSSTDSRPAHLETATSLFALIVLTLFRRSPVFALGGQTPAEYL